MKVGQCLTIKLNRKRIEMTIKKFLASLLVGVFVLLSAGYVSAAWTNMDVWQGPAGEEIKLKKEIGCLIGKCWGLKIDGKWELKKASESRAKRAFKQKCSS